MVRQSFLSEILCVCKRPVRHSLSITHFGSPNGIPIVFLHGGPGGQSRPKTILKMNIWDLNRYRLVFFDQRGCGRSTPRNELQCNTPQHTVNDIEHIRQHYAFDKILLYGQSYGTALALMYANQHNTNVGGCILHGVFLCEDIFHPSLFSKHPRIWKRLQTITRKRTLHDVAHFVSQSIQTNTPHNKKIAVVNNWCALENSELRSSTKKASMESKYTVALLESHYHFHSFFGCSKDLLQQCKIHMHSTPTLILHGTDDLICPIQNAERLHQVLGKHSVFVRIKKGRHYLQCTRRHHRTANRICAFLNTIL